MKLRIQLILFTLLMAVTNISADVAVLNFYADGQHILSADVNAGTSYTLSTLLADSGIVMTGTGCRDYNFVGWKTGGPVVGDETPTLVTNVTPLANMNFYAVYEKTGAAPNRFKRITSTKDLHADEQYLLVCYYEWDGDIYYGPSYFAMENVENETSLYYRNGDSAYIDARGQKCALYARRYYLRARQLTPDAGVIDNPANAVVWTLGGSDEHWTLTNVATPTKSLNISSNYSDAAYLYNDALYEYTPDYNDHLLANTGNTFAITAANGRFNFRADNGYYLSYSEDDDDYFITKTSNSWSFYLYKKESAYTSFPNCEDWKLWLDAADGFVGTSANHKVDSLEREPGAGIILPAATPPSCDITWTFAGWSSEVPIQGTTDLRVTLHSPGTLYHPMYDGEILYAVYYKTETITKYVKTTTSPLTNGTYLIVAKDGNYYYPMGSNQVNSTPWTNTLRYYAVQATTTVEVNASGEIIGAQNSQFEWNWTSNNSRFQNVLDGTRYVNPNRTGAGYNGNPYYYNVIGGAASLTLNLSGELWAISRGRNRLVYQEGEFFDYYDNSSSYPMFYLFKKSTISVTTHTSYPHCTKYSITLDACGGTIGGIAGKVTDVLQEETAGAGWVLPSCTPRCSDDGWEFAGWLEGDDLAAVEDVDFTGLHSGRYVPSRDGIKLYAVYRRILDRFQIIHGPSGIVSGDTYLITNYAKESDESEDIYDWMLSGTRSGSFLTAVRAGAPQNNEGYYIEESDSTLMWVITEAGSNWNFQNLSTSQYLYIGTDGSTSTTIGANPIITQDYDGFAMFIYNDNVDVLYCDFANLAFKAENRVGHILYIFRRAKEFTSWPHCETEKFTVNFDAGNGTAGATSLTETEAYSGVTLPDAYANSDCSKEGWTFAGWATSPIREESDVLTVDLWPAGAHYSLTSNNSTLYAVYYVKEDTYKRLGAVADLRLGVNYIVATDGNKALGNTMTASDTTITAIDISAIVDGNVVTSTNAALEWRLQGRAGEYVLYNPANNVYIDLRTARHAYLATTAVDNFLISYVSGSFRVHSNQSIVGYAAPKYLSYNETASAFNTAEVARLSTLYFYQQEAIYHSSPSCISDVDVIKWETAADGNYVTVESYLLSGEPAMDGASGHATDQATDKSGTAQDGTWLIKYTDASLAPCSQTTVAWGDKTADIRIPYIVDENTTSTDLLGATDCRTCDLVVMSGNTFTVDNNKRLHMVTVQEGATLNIADGATLTVNSLVLGANSDQNAPIVNLNNLGAIVLKNGELYYDLRIPEDRYYWISLPFASQTQEISYSNVAANGGMPVYNEDFFVYYYDGASRAADANAGSVKDTYWTPVAANGVDYTMQAGQGYLFAILDQASTPQTDGRYHTKRVMRFTMRPPVATWLTQERVGGSKTTTVSPSACTDSRQAFHAGWNLIGNPYMHAYNTGTVSGGDESGLSNGAWTKEIKNAVWTGSWILDETDPTNRPTNVPYITVFDPAATDEYPYSQSLATDFDFRPFQAVFVQVNEGNSLNFLANMAVPASAPAYKRFIQPEVPVRTGVTLSGLGRSDRTGIVLSNEYTTQYEIGADLQKMFNGGLNLYTLNADNQQLAFNGLSEEDAIAPIPVGVTIPTTGEYTFAFDADKYSMQALDKLMLIDYVQDTQTNLLYGNYTFTADQGRNENRFALLVRLAKTPQITTELDNIYDADKPRKIIRDGMLFILRDDKMYNAVGIEVR